MRLTGSREVVGAQIDDYDRNDYVEIIPASGDMSYEKILTESTASDSVSKGRTLYAKCNIAVTNRLLQGKTVPSFFGSGSLHSLANEPSEQPKIGWHPNYVDMLKEENDE